MLTLKTMNEWLETPKNGRPEARGLAAIVLDSRRRGQRDAHGLPGRPPRPNPLRHATYLRGEGLPLRRVPSGADRAGAEGLGRAAVSDDRASQR